MFNGLPDPERYAHPRWSWLAGLTFVGVLGGLFRVEHDVPDDWRLPSGTLLVSNHLRDADGPLLGAVLAGRDGCRLRRPLPYFVMREDLFRPEALANLLFACPRPVGRALAHVPITWLFDLLRTRPLRRTREFTWHDVLCLLVDAGLGDRAPETVFNARGLRELASRLGSLPPRVDAIDPWDLGRMRVESWALRRLTLSALEILAVPFRAAVEEQLQGFVTRLDEGGDVYLAPEGHTSMDGRFGRIRAATWRLGAMTGRPLPVQSFAVSYDPLGPGRTRILMRKGCLLDDLDFDDSAAVRRRVRHAIEARRVVTTSHLLALFLERHDDAFAAEDVIAWLRRGRDAVQAANREVDPLLIDADVVMLVARRLQWLARKRLVARDGNGWRSCWQPETAPSWFNTAGQARYLANALVDFAPDVARELSS